MTNPEDKPAGNTTPKTTDGAVAENQMRSEFLERVSEIPVVNAAKEYSTAAYNQVKQMNRFAAVALSAAETTALYFAVTAKPFLEKVQPHGKMNQFLKMHVHIFHTTSYEAIFNFVFMMEYILIENLA